MKNLTTSRAQRMDDLGIIIKTINLILSEPNNQEHLKANPDDYYTLLTDELELIADKGDLPEGLTMEEYQFTSDWLTAYLGTDDQVHCLIRHYWPDNPDILAYLHDSFIEPMSELGYKATSYEYDEDCEHVLTFVDNNEALNPGFITKLNHIMAQGHDDGNDAPNWCYIAGKLYITIPYEA